MRRLLRLLCARLLLMAASPLRAQDVTPADTVAQSVVRADSASTWEPPSARSALLRSLVLPGWGQAKVGSYTRGGIYFGIGATSWFMLLKTIGKLDEARDRASAQRGFVIDSLHFALLSDPALRDQLSPLRNRDAFDAAVDADERVANADLLVAAREQQRQDWIAYTLFFTFLNAVDAYVAAQLSDFPADFDVEGRTDGGVSLRVQLPVGGRP
jgi:hypothetical protein